MSVAKRRLTLNHRSFHGALIAALLLAAAAPAAVAKPKVAVLSLTAKRVAPETVQILDTLLLTELGRHGFFEVISTADINTLLGYERMKEVAGCDDVTCAVEIGGALGAEFLLAGSVGKLGDEIIISLTLLDSQRQQVTSRAERTVKDDEREYASALREAVARLLGVSERPASTGSGTATLELTTTPAGATCTIAGKRVGVTPCNLTIVAGLHGLELELEHHHPYKELLQAQPGTAITRAVKLEAFPVPVRFESTPPGAAVRVDEKLVGETPLSVPLAPGDYAVRVVAHGYEAIEHRVAVQPGPSAAFAWTLSAMPVEVTVSTTPPGAAIEITGAATHRIESGATVKLAPGDYQVRADLVQHATHRRSLSIPVGKTLELTIPLEPGWSDAELATLGTKRALAWLFTGVAAGGGALFTWQGLRARSIDSSLEGASYSSGTEGEVASGRSAALKADIGLAVGIVSAAVASYLWNEVTF